MTAAWLVAAAAVAGGCGDSPPRAQIDAPGSATPVLDVSVELAITAVQRETGLRGHAPLAADQGLLIELPETTEVCIVNDGVTFAIDVIYADPTGAVIAVADEIAAQDPTSRCQDNVLDVLELGAGVAADVVAGDTLIID